VHPQGERDHRERVPDQRDSQGRDDQPQVSVSPDRRPTVALTTNYRKELLHVYERIASQSDGVKAYYQAMAETSDAATERTTLTLTGPRAIRAIAHEARQQVIDELYSGSVLTATEAARICGLSPLRYELPPASVGEVGDRRSGTRTPATAAKDLGGRAPTTSGSAAATWSREPPCDKPPTPSSRH